MSEPIRTSAQKRAKLATALKRNMARRKAVTRVESPESSKAALAPLPSGEVGEHRETGEGIMPSTHSPHPQSHAAIATSPEGRGKMRATS